MQKLAIPPDAANYQVQFGSPVVSTQLEGGAPRVRSDNLGVAHTVNVSWTVDAAKYNYLVAFFRTGTVQGALPFLVDLVIDGAAPTEYTAYFVPDSFALDSQSGDTYVVKSSLTVLPAQIDSDGDQELIATFQSL